MMQKPISLVLILLSLVLVWSCKDDDDCSCNREIFGKWEAEAFMSLESKLYSKDDNYKPVIEFKNDGSIDLQLDANACFGEFELQGEDGIQISDVGCTEMCCDSEFSMKFAGTLSQVDRYQIDGDTLLLFDDGWGFIELNRVLD